MMRWVSLANVPTATFALFGVGVGGATALLHRIPAHARMGVPRNNSVHKPSASGTPLL